MGNDWKDVENEFAEFQKTPTWKWTKIVAATTLGLPLLLSTVYIVSPDEEGVVQRFGKYVRSTTQGPHLKLPWPIEKVTTPKVTEIKKQEFGFRTLKAGIQSTFDEAGDYTAESHMLTGDANIVDLEFIVQYKIKDAPAFLFNVRDPEGTLRDASEAAIRQVVGDRGIDEALTTEKVAIQQETSILIQKIMDSYNAGIHIVTVNLQDVNPPKGKVRDAFHEVNNADQARTTMINTAWADYNQTIPKARGEADKTIREAEAYGIERVNIAKGDADRFLKMWSEYKKAPDVTKKRMYLEAMEQILPGIKDIIIVDEDAEGVLKFLDVGGSKK